jgi:hypothetical protein
MSSWGFHVNFEKPGVDLSDTVLRLRKLDDDKDGTVIRARYDGISNLRREFRGNSVDGRIKSVREKLYKA